MLTADYCAASFAIFGLPEFSQSSSCDLLKRAVVVPFFKTGIRLLTAYDDIVRMPKGRELIFLMKFAASSGPTSMSSNSMLIFLF